jgi:hypothetical protein
MCVYVLCIFYIASKLAYYMLLLIIIELGPKPEPAPVPEPVNLNRMAPRLQLAINAYRQSIQATCAN